jgi:hypothetical protein
MKNVVVPWRDGRDVMVSWYHQQLIEHQWNRAQVARSRRELPLEDYEDVRRNLPAFIEYAFTRPHSPPFSWADFVRRWHDREGTVNVRYEDLRRDTPNELRRIVRELTGEKLGPAEGERHSRRVLLRAPVGAARRGGGQRELPAQGRRRGLASPVRPRGAGGLRQVRRRGADPARLRAGPLVGRVVGTVRA